MICVWWCLMFMYILKRKILSRTFFLLCIFPVYVYKDGWHWHFPVSCVCHRVLIWFHRERDIMVRLNNNSLQLRFSFHIRRQFNERNSILYLHVCTNTWCRLNLANILMGCCYYGKKIFYRKLSLCKYTRVWSTTNTKLL